MEVHIFLFFLFICLLVCFFFFFFFVKSCFLIQIHECLVRVGVSEFGRVAMHKSLCLVLSLCDIVSDSFVSRLLSLSEYKMAVAAARADVSGRLLVILLQLPTEVQDRALLRQNVTEFLSLARSFSLLRAAACCERLMRLCPPYDVTQLAFYLQLVRLDSVTPELPEAPELVCHAMAALDAARRTVPSVWFRGAGKKTTENKRVFLF
jgi:hypothetical protein